MSVVISSQSKERIFHGNLYKAPPLNRRGRKTWRERFIVLRANRTLECYKSKKSADSNKSPRRVIDLRECINLEVGLEYKRFNFVFCLGTFKRTFFFAAQSDPLMLQWANVLEKTKNAEEGSAIEVLDIGLRKSRDVPAIHRVKPATPTHRFSIGSPNKTFSNITDGSKSTMALAHFTRDSTDTINLRESQGSEFDQPDGTLYDHRERRARTRSKSPHFPVVFRSKRDPKMDQIVERNPSTASERSTTSTASHQSPSHVTHSPSHVTHSPSHVTHSPSHVTGVVYIPNKVPPPSGVLATATRNKDGYFVSNKQDTAAVSKTHSGVKSKRDKKAKFVEKPGSLQRVRGVRGASPKPTESLVPGPNVTGQTGLKQNNAAINLHSNMRRSFRYRKITLRPQKPLFVDLKENDNSDSEDEGEGNSSDGGVFTKVRGQFDSVEISEEDLKKAGPNFGSPTLGGRKTLDLKALYQEPPRANSYSKVTVVGVKCEAEYDSRSCGITNTRLDDILSKTKKTPRMRSSSQSAATPTNHVTSNLHHMTTLTSLSQDNFIDVGDSLLDTLSPPPLDDENDDIIGESPEVFDIELPAPNTANSFMYSSTNSLDNILVDPPEMFSESTDGDEQTNVEEFNAQTTAHVTWKSDSESTDQSHMTHHLTRIIPSPYLPSPEEGVASNDRNSTESNDTGYTSGANPNFHGKTNEASVREFKLEFKEAESSSTTSSSSGDIQEVVMNIESSGSTPLGENSSTYDPTARFFASQASIASTGSDYTKLYVPMVFLSSKKSPSETNLFAIQVCLVENSDELIKDLVALKSLESFSIVECDEIQGNSNMAAFGDDFTVETALEDLEFGFSVIKSTQKDLFMRKVRQFQFDIRNLFGTMKPFSCDVEIKYADQVLILPIEVQTR